MTEHRGGSTAADLREDSVCAGWAAPAVTRTKSKMTKGGTRVRATTQ